MDRYAFQVSLSGICDSPLVAVPTRGGVDRIRRCTRGDYLFGRGGRSRYCDDFNVSANGRQVTASHRRRSKIVNFVTPSGRMSALRFVCHCMPTQGCPGANLERPSPKRTTGMIPRVIAE